MVQVTLTIAGLVFFTKVQALVIDTDTTWIAGDQYFTETVTVNNSATLTIEAGAVLHFQTNNKLLISDGSKLLIEGTDVLPVILTSDSAIQSGWWGIEVTGERLDTSDIQIDHAVIEYAKYGVSYLQGSKGDITNSDIKDSTRGVFYNGKRTGGLIENSAIYNNQYGVYITGAWGYLVDHPSPVVNNNQFTNNSSYHYYSNYFYDNDKVILDAKNNWWGSSDLSQIVSGIYDQADNVSYAPSVDFSSALSSVNGLPIAGTFYTSSIINDTTWSALDGVLLQPIYVHSGNILTVTAGAYIEALASSQLIIKPGGKLNIIGEQANLATFTGINKTKTGWKGIKVEGERADYLDIQIDYAVIENAIDSVRFEAGAKGKISNSILRNGTQGVYFYGKNSGGLITNNQIIDNTYGVRLYGGYGYLVDHPSVLVNGNAIYNNSAYDFYATGYYDSHKAIVNATGNWWGTSDAGAISSHIYDYVDSSSYSPSVDFSGFLDAENGSSVSGTFYLTSINSDTTWNAVDGQLAQKVTIQTGATLTVDAGAQITAASNSEIIVKDGAKLIIQGTELQPVIFNGTSAAKNAWKGILIQGERANSLDVQISYVVIENATSAIKFDTGSRGDVRHSVLKNNTQGIYFYGARTGGLLTNNEIYDNTYGINVYGAYTYLVDHPTPVVVQNSIYSNTYNYYANAFRDNGQRILDAKQNWWGSTDLFTIAAGVYNYPDSTTYAPSVDFSSPLNGENGAVLSGTFYLNSIAVDTTWNATDGLLGQPVTVQSGATLFIDAGTQITASQNTELIIKPGGQLMITGSSVSPVLLVGDSPVKSRWKGIKIQGERADTTEVQINYAMIEHAVNAIKFDTGSKGDIRSSIIKNNTNGINYYGARTGGLAAQNTISDNTYGIYVYGAYKYLADHPSPSVNQNNLFNNTYNYYANSFYDNDKVMLDGTGNWWGSTDIESIISGIYDYNDSSSYAPLIDFRGYLSSENGSPVAGEQMLGHITGHERWNNSTLKILGDISVQSGGSLSIEAGSQLTFAPNAQLIVEKGASLAILGDANAPIILTSDKITKAAGDWKGIKVSAENSDVNISHAIIEYADKGIYFYGKQAKGFVTNNVISKNKYGIYVDGLNKALVDHPTPTVTHNEFSANTLYDYYAKSFGTASSRTLNAKGNAWGSLDDATIHTGIYDNRDSTSSPIVDTGSARHPGDSLVTANAGADVITFGTISTPIEGSGSSTIGTIAEYRWEQSFGGAITLSQGDQATATITPDDVIGEENNTFVLTVTDSNGIAASDKVDVAVRPLSDYNLPPVVPNNVVQIVDPLSAVNIAMTSTDPDGDILTYQWTQLKGTSVSLTNSTGDTLDFVAPELANQEVLSFRLTVSDGKYNEVRDIKVGVKQKTTSAGTYYYHNDHLGTPQVMTDETAVVVWQANYSPFGKADLLVESVTSNIRFPGQYFDAETNLHYNYFRDYDPEIGRYIQSDPIGLAGGINTYAYVSGNPINEIDPNGLFGFNPRSAFLVGRLIGDAQARYLISQAAEDSRKRGALCDAGICIGGDAPIDPNVYQDGDGIIPSSGTDTPIGEECEVDEKNCMALKQSILNTCYGLKGRKRMACFEAANTAYRQCMGYE